MMPVLANVRNWVVSRRAAQTARQSQVLAESGRSILHYAQTAAEWRRENAIMPLYAVSYQHPDEGGWKEHVMPHVAWLQERLKDGSLIASGPLTDLSTKSALLIMCAPGREILERLIATDPFAIHGLIEDMSVNEWDPIFGIFNDRSSMPGLMQSD